jgi:hypothetical protein
MQKFRKYIYCNHEILEDFINQIDELSSVEKEIEKETSSTIGGSGGIGIAKIDSEISENTKTTLETRLSDIERFISWSNKPKNSLSINETIPKIEDKGVICTISGKAYLPEKVEDFELLESFKDNLELFSSIEGIDRNDVKQAQLLKNSSSVPILIDAYDNYVINCSITKKYLRENISDFFESIDDEITIIGRIDNVYVDGEVEIFDMAKECLRINRAVRRKMSPQQLKDITVYEESPLIKITPLIIYK